MASLEADPDATGSLVIHTFVVHCEGNDICFGIASIDRVV